MEKNNEMLNGSITVIGNVIGSGIGMGTANDLEGS